VDGVLCVIYKENPISGGGRAEFPDHVLMTVTVRVTLTLFDEATIF